MNRMRSRTLLAPLVALPAGLLALALAARAQSPADGADLALGKARFEVFCASCHGAAGDGQGPAAKGLTPPPRNFTVGDFRYGGTDKDIFEVISNGAASKGGSPLMAAWGPIIPEAERWALVRYIRSLKK